MTNNIVAKIKAMPFGKGLKEALSLVSDDFGHDCTALLEAESELFQHFGNLFESKLAKAVSALEFYDEKLDYLNGQRARATLGEIKGEV